MKFTYNSETGQTDYQLQTDDICLFCETEEVCPLLQALMINLVYPSCDKLTIAECGCYIATNLHEER